MQVLVELMSVVDELVVLSHSAYTPYTEAVQNRDLFWNV